MTNTSLSLRRYIKFFKDGMLERFYAVYFSFIVLALYEKREYVFVDIDNTVNTQATRLLRFMKDGYCDYRRANGFGQLIRDLPVPGSVAFISKLSKRFQIIWLTSRSIKLMPATYYWLKKYGFPVHALVCTGSMPRKISFIEFFIKNRTIDFVIDDMKEGYEYGNPQYVFPYKEYLRLNNIEVFEDLSAVDLRNKLEDNNV